MVHGQVGKDFAVEPYLAGRKAVHEVGVGEPVLPGGCADTLHPQGAKGTLFVAAVAVGVGEALFYGVFSYGPDVFASTPKAFGLLEDSFLACFGGGGVGGAWHGSRGLQV